MDEVNVDTVDVRRELLELVQPTFLLAPVEPVAPVGDERAPARTERPREHDLSNDRGGAGVALPDHRRMRLNLPDATFCVEGRCVPVGRQGASSAAPGGAQGPRRRLPLTRGTRMFPIVFAVSNQI